MPLSALYDLGAINLYRAFHLLSILYTLKITKLNSNSTPLYEVLLNLASKLKLYGWQSQSLYSLRSIIVRVVRPPLVSSHWQTVASSQQQINPQSTRDFDCIP